MEPMAPEILPRVLFVVSGSVATIKMEEIVKGLLQFAKVKVVATKAAQHFFDIQKIRALGVTVYTDEDEYEMWNNRGDPVLHIVLSYWADLLLWAPLSANSLAKISNGIADNLGTSIIRAWDFKHYRKPILLCPAMNTKMWEHPFTANQLNILTSDPLNMIVINPLSQVLECGDVGMGAMVKPPEIMTEVKNNLPTLKYLRTLREYEHTRKNNNVSRPSNAQPNNDSIVNIENM
jgi:phosphopantothenoylcysteine decarboxylase